MPETDSTGSVGVFSINGTRFLHNGDNGASNVSNVFLGPNAGNFSATAANCVGIGENALTNATSGSNCVAVGDGALQANTTGRNNVGIGLNALNGAPDKDGLIAIGQGALSATPAGNFTSILAIGTTALSSVTQARRLVGIGQGAMNQLDTGTFNVAVGSRALQGASGGLTNVSNNTVVGDLAMNGVTSSEQRNVVVGGSALNTAAGGNTARVKSVAIGYASLGSLSDGANNTAVGAVTAFTLSTGEDNIIIGNLSADNYSAAESSNIIIGNTAVSGESNVMRLGTQGSSAGQQNKTHIVGIYNTSTNTTPREALVVDSNHQFGTNTNLIGDYQTDSGSTMSVGQGYIANNGSNTATFTLPSSPAVGDVVQVVGRDSGGWQINQNSGDTIYQGSSFTSPGSGGNLASSNQWTSVKLMHVGSGDWLIIANDGSGSLTFT